MLKHLNKGLLIGQGLLLVSVFAFFNTEMSFFTAHFAAWGKYLVYPGFMLTDILMSIIATIQFIKSPPEEKTTASKLMLGISWVKTAAVFGAAITGLGVISGATWLSAPLLISGLSLFALTELALSVLAIKHDMYPDHQSKQQSGKPFSMALSEHKMGIISPLIVLTTVACIAVGSFKLFPIMFILPSVGALHIAIGMCMGLATIALAFALGSKTRPDANEMKLGIPASMKSTARQPIPIRNKKKQAEQDAINNRALLFSFAAKKNEAEVVNHNNNVHTDTVTEAIASTSAQPSDQQIPGVLPDLLLHPISREEQQKKEKMDFTLRTLGMK